MPFSRLTATTIAVTAAAGGGGDGGIGSAPSSSSSSSSSQVFPAAYRYYIPNPYLTSSPRGHHDSNNNNDNNDNNDSNNNDNKTELLKKYELMSRKRSDLKRALNWQKRLAQLARATDKGYQGQHRDKGSDKMLLLEDGSGGGEGGSEQMVRSSSNDLDLDRVSGENYGNPNLLEMGNEEEEEDEDEDYDEDGEGLTSPARALPPSFVVPSLDEWLLAWSVHVTPAGEVLLNGSSSASASASASSEGGGEGEGEGGGDGLMHYGRAMILAAGRHTLRCIATPSPTLLDPQVSHINTNSHTNSHGHSHSDNDKGTGTATVFLICDPRL